MEAKASDGSNGESAKSRAEGRLYLVNLVPGLRIIKIAPSGNTKGHLRSLRATSLHATMVGNWGNHRAWESLVRWHATFSSHCRHFGGEAGAVVRRIGGFIQEHPILNRNSPQLGTARGQMWNWVRFHSLPQAGACRMVGRIRGGIATLLGRLVPRSVHPS